LALGNYPTTWPKSARPSTVRQSACLHDRTCRWWQEWQNLFISIWRHSVWF